MDSDALSKAMVLRDEGLSYQAIADILGYHQTTVWAEMKRLGYPGRNYKKKNELTLQMLELRKHKLTLAQIAARLDVSEWRVREYFRAYGITGKLKTYRNHRSN